MIKSFLYCFRVWQYCHEARTFLRNMESIEDTCVSFLFVRNLQTLFSCCCRFMNGYNFKFGRFALRSTYLLLYCSQYPAGVLRWMGKVKHFHRTPRFRGPKFNILLGTPWILAKNPTLILLMYNLDVTVQFWDPVRN